MPQSFVIKDIMQEPITWAPDNVNVGHCWSKAKTLLPCEFVSPQYHYANQKQMEHPYTLVCINLFILI